METTSTLHMDGYRLVKRLGKSSTGETYQAEDQTLGIPLILKILDSALGQNEEFLHRYQTAWRAAAQWNNRHMVRVLAFRRASRQVYVVTEYLRGKSLEQIIFQNGALPCSAALPLIKRLLRVVHLAHSQGIFCLDLKPRNIFLTPTGLILTDVDTATILLDTTHSLPRLDHAALSAIPPEYFTAQGTRDQRGQIYALGITLYQMLSGRLPFDSRLSPQELPRRIVREPIPSLRLYNPEIPRPLETLVTTALAKVPGDRYPSVEEMLRDFLTLEEHHSAVMASSEKPKASSPTPTPVPEQQPTEQTPPSEEAHRITERFFTNGVEKEPPERNNATPRETPPPTAPPSEAPIQERSGEMVGQYRLVEKVAEDGDGEWYRAVATRSHRTVALKFLPAEQLRDRERRRRFANEVEAANALRHFGIVRVHEIGNAGEREFLALEWVEGQRLADLLKSGPLELEPAVNIAVQIAEVLQRTHQSGIIHGALHPSCIHITSEGVVRLSGFGFAALWAGRPLTREEPFLPTCGYLAPEVVLGNMPDAGCDIFSLGVILYEMLSGQHPFRRETTRETIFAIVMNDRRPLTEVAREAIPPELGTIVERALAKHGHERYETMHQMAEDLMAVKARVQELQIASTFSLIGDEGNSLFGYQSVEELLAQRQKIDQLIAVQHTKYLTVMFCDLVDSTTYFERRGDLEGRVMVQRYYGLMTPLIKKHEGSLVKTIGDGILATFVNPVDACHCAREMQEALQEYNCDKQEMDHIRVRIALHYGRAVIEKGDIFGDVVNVTARVEEMAGAGEILLSEAVYHRCRTQPEFTFAPCGTCRFKGKSGEIGVYRLVWNPEVDNASSPAPSANGHPSLSPQTKQLPPTEETGKTVSELPAMEETLIAPRNSSIRILRGPSLKTAAAEPEPTPKEIINPYMNRVKIKNIEEFYGRKAEVAKIYARLDADRPQSVSIVGERRIGKSSLLNYIAHPANRTTFLRQPEQYVFVCIDFQEKHRLDIPGFISAVYEALQVSFGGGLQMEVPPTYAGLKQVVTTLEESGYKLVMLFDEFERVTRNPNFDAEFFSFCRSIANNYNVAYVVASGRNLQSLCHSREIADSPFFNIFSNITLSQFPHQEAVELIVQPARKYGLFMEPHIPFILDIAGYYPIFIQMACAAVFEFLRMEDTFTEATYERIREEFLDEARVHFQHIWSSCNEVQQETLRNLARKRSLSDSQSYVLKELIRAGYVKLQDQEPRIFSSLFEEFVLRQAQVRPNARSRFPFWRRD